jgi:hypothetical protein
MRRPLSGVGPSCDGSTLRSPDHTPPCRSSRISTRTRVAEDGSRPSVRSPPVLHGRGGTGERGAKYDGSSRVPRPTIRREVFYRYGTHPAAVLLPSSPPSGAPAVRPGDGDAEATPSVRILHRVLLVWRWRVPPPMERTTSGQWMGFAIYLCLAVLGWVPFLRYCPVARGRGCALEMNWNNEANHNAISRRRPWVFALAVIYMHKKIIVPPCIPMHQRGCLVGEKVWVRLL